MQLALQNGPIDLGQFAGLLAIEQRALRRLFSLRRCGGLPWPLLADNAFRKRGLVALASPKAMLAIAITPAAAAKRLVGREPLLPPGVYPFGEGGSVPGGWAQ